jgi:hypothetical protein
MKASNPVGTAEFGPTQHLNKLKVESCAQENNANLVADATPA